MELSLNEVWDNAIEAHQSGNFSHAEELYSAVILHFPKHEDAHHNLAVLKYQSKQYDKSLISVSHAILLNESKIEFWNTKLKIISKLNSRQALVDFYHEVEGSELNVIEKNSLLSQCLIINEQQNLSDTDGLIELDSLVKNKSWAKSNRLIDALIKKNPLSVHLKSSKALILSEMGKASSALDLTKKLINIFPESDVLYFNLGCFYQRNNNVTEAQVSYEKAIELNENNFKSYLNLGNLFYELGELERALLAYENALKDDELHSQAILGICNIFSYQGKFFEILSLFNSMPKNKLDEKLLMRLVRTQITLSDYNSALQNLVYIKNNYPINRAVLLGLLGVNLEQGNIDECFQMLGNIDIDDILRDSNWFALGPIVYALGHLSNYDVKSILNQAENSSGLGQKYKFTTLKYHLEANDFNKVQQHTEELRGRIRNEIFYGRPSNQLVRDDSPALVSKNYEKVVVLFNFGRSGTGLLHSLLDNHKKIMCLPSVFMSEFFNPDMVKKMGNFTLSEAVDFFVRYYDLLFDSTSSVGVDIEGTLSDKTFNFGLQEGLTSLGDAKNESILLDRIRFKSDLMQILGSQKLYNHFDFFVGINLAVQRQVFGDANKSVLLYHIHNPSLLARETFFCNAPHAAVLITIREPIQNLSSWVSKVIDDIEMTRKRMLELLNFMDKPMCYTQACHIVRLEDLKNNSMEMLANIADFLGIEIQETMTKMSVLGKKWWGDPVSQDYEIDGMKPFGKTSINRKSVIFSKSDVKKMEIIFYPFSEFFGYCEQNDEAYFQSSSKLILELDDPFDFEKDYALNNKIEPNNLILSAGYKLFRQELKTKILNEKNLNKYRKRLKKINSKFTEV